MCMLWFILHSSYYILYIHIRPSIPYIVGALSCIWGLLMRVFSGTGNAKYYRAEDRIRRILSLYSRPYIRHNIRVYSLICLKLIDFYSAD